MRHALVFCLLLAGCDSPHDGPRRLNPGVQMPSLGPATVTYDEYVQLTKGMSYAQIVAIIGEEGRENSRYSMDLGPGNTQEVVSYQWTNPGGSILQVMLQNDKLLMKHQLGLR